MEIERKFLLNEIPKELSPIKKAVIRQSYISISPEVRIRERINFTPHKYTDYKLCFKSDGDLTREEIEVNVDFKSYEDLLTMLMKKPIYKEYYAFDIGNNLIAECSIVDKYLDSKFMYVEVEFKSEEEANKFIPLSWFGKEVTYDKEYKMKNYWNKTRLIK